MKQTIARKISNALVLASLIAGSMGVLNNTPASAKTCPIGYSLVGGKCKAIKATSNKRLSAMYYCTTSITNWTPAKYKACMKSKGFK